MKNILTIFLFILLLNAVAFSQSSYGRRYNAFSGTMVLTIEGGPTFGMTDYPTTTVDYMGRSQLEYFLPAYSKSSFGFRVLGGAGFISGKDRISSTSFRTKISYVGGGVVYSLSLRDAVFPYLFAGINYLVFDPLGDQGEKLPNNILGLYKKHELNYLGELGLRIMLTDNLSFNLSAGAEISPNDYLDDIVKGTNNDLFFNAMAGVSFAFFTQSDEDGDGVVDSKDMCPNTPRGVKVDALGCPIDSDGDGVPDYLDKCPGTQQKVKVDSHGCPLDSDGDGVPDYLDLCPGTPRGVKVDEFGCPFDMDADGVPDYLDKCPNTPPNVEVDKNGCPVDSDGDGVPDYLDKCPATPKGEKVDASGCPVAIKKEEPKPAKENDVKEIVLSSSANFAFGSSKLLPSAYAALDKIVERMKSNPSTRWRIEGHTDNIGSQKANKKVSLERAQAVLNYFVSKGLDKKRFEVIGLGEAYPIASNSTESGRAKNRRVVIIRIN